MRAILATLRAALAAASSYARLRSTRRRRPARAELAHHVRRRGALRTHEPSAVVLGTAQGQAKRRRPAHPRYIYLYDAVSPKDGRCAYLIMPTSNTDCFLAFLDALAKKLASEDILLVLDGTPNHRCGSLAVPSNISLVFLPPYAPELNPQENIWQYLRQNQLSNRVFQSYDAIVDACCDAWNALTTENGRIQSIATRPGAPVNL